MATVRLNWQAPTTRASGRPLNPADIAGYIVEQSLDNAPFVRLTDSPAAATSRDVQNLGPGVFRFRVACFDTKNAEGAPVEGSIEIPDDSPPGLVLNLTLSIAASMVSTQS